MCIFWLAAKQTKHAACIWNPVFDKDVGTAVVTAAVFQNTFLFLKGINCSLAILWLFVESAIQSEATTVTSSQCYWD